MSVTENRENTQIPEVDLINHPAHYTYAGMECIDMMRALYGREAVIAYCKCAAFKYVYRKGHKGTDEDAARDMEKAAWYARKAEELEHGSPNI
jgi:hypothetical protein